LYSDINVCMHIDGPRGGKWLAIWELLMILKSRHPQVIDPISVRIDTPDGGKSMTLHELGQLTGGELPMPAHELAARCKNMTWYRIVQGESELTNYRGRDVPPFGRLLHRPTITAVGDRAVPVMVAA
jgi:hypothetical protein